MWQGAASLYNAIVVLLFLENENVPRMSNLTTELIELIEELALCEEPPSIESFVFPPTFSEGSKQNNFAYLNLSDGSVGMTYIGLDFALAGLVDHVPGLSLRGRCPTEIVPLYRETAGWQRALGLAAINAISQSALKHYPALSEMPATLPSLALSSEDQVGMVGYFSRLVNPLRASGIPLTVIELDQSLVSREPGIEVTLDTNKLARCNKVIVTGTTLLNHTADYILQCCETATDIVMLGPTASCLPEPLFARGVTMLGGFHVTDAAQFAERWSSGERWREGGLRYGLSVTDWPGTADIIKSSVLSV